MKEAELGLGIDDHQPVRLGDLRGDLREVFGARHSDRDREPELRPHAASNRFRNFDWGTKEMDRALDIGKGLVDRDPLDERCEITQHLDRGVAQPLVVLEMAADKSELRTEFARPPSRHPAANPERLGFIRGGQHHAPTNGDRPAAQRRVEQLLDRGVEGIQIRVEDRGYCLHPDNSPRTLFEGKVAVWIWRTLREHSKGCQAADAV